MTNAIDNRATKLIKFVSISFIVKLNPWVDLLAINS